MDKVHIRTQSGFEVDLDQDAMDDMELSELLDAIMDEQADARQKMHAYTNIAQKILGDDGKKALYAHLKNESGRVPHKKVFDEIGDLIKGLGSKKN